VLKAIYTARGERRMWLGTWNWIKGLFHPEGGNKGGKKEENEGTKMSSARVRRGPALIRLVLFIQEREMCNYNYAKDTRSIGSKSLLFHETSEDDQSVTTFSREKINGDPPFSLRHSRINCFPSVPQIWCDLLLLFERAPTFYYWASITERFCV
jgi:hypothetical protein